MYIFSFIIIVTTQTSGMCNTVKLAKVGLLIIAVYNSFCKTAVGGHISLLSHSCPV